MDEKNVASLVLLSDELVLPTIGHIGGRVVLPGSKSISNRALLLAALAQGTTKLDNLLYSDDIRHMMTALRLLGIDCQLAEDKRSCQVTGGDSQFTFDKAVELFLGNAGTAMRPLAAALAVVAQPQYPVTLTGEPRMLERPIKHLVEALIQGGADIRYQGKKGFPPLQIKGGFQGGEIALNGSVSSQFLTALLLAAPLAPKETYIVVKGDLVSQPYAEMTVQMMEQFGMLIQHDPEFRHFFIRGGQNYYAPGYFWVEGDASSASYFLAAAAIKGGEIRVDGVGKKSIQGDKQFGRVLAKMGAKVYYGDNYIECVGGYPLHGIDVDVNAIPDAAMTLATTALFAKGTTTLRNIGNWRVKETDRLTAMATELRKVGATVEEGQDYISITPPVHWQHARINTYNDHRMAMCFSLVALSAVGVTILDPTCVSKTFPDYFERLAQICG